MFGLSSLKLIAIAAAVALAVGGPALGAWKLGSSTAQLAGKAETAVEVQAVKSQYQDLLKAQTDLADHYRGLADSKYEALTQQLSNIKVVNTTVTNNITRERAADPVFYSQLLPIGGQKQWDDARKLFHP